MNIDAPATFWGDSQTYQNRRVTANGRVVVDEKQDFRGFLKKYFRFAGTEVLPGIDTFEQCVQKAFSPKEFDVEVTDGKIEIGFEGKNWSNCLSALVIYPAEKSDGKKFLQWVTERRRAQFTEYFRQMEPKRSPAPAESYALFTRHFMTPVNAYDGPKEGEQIGPVGLSVTVARGEEMPLTFALQPTGDVGEIDLKVSELKNEGGTVLAAGAILPGWVDYRIIRLTVDGAAYSVQPCYWHPTPAPAAPGVTRRFWLRVRTAADAPAGVYKGQVTLRPAKAAAQTIPISVRVLPITLDEVGELAVGPWGVWIRPGNWEGPQANAWTWTMFDKALTVLRADGWTSFSAVPSIKVKAADGKVAFDFTEADKQMEMIRAKGFRHMISAYGSDAEMGYSLKGQGDGVDAAAATGAGFADFDSFLKAIWLPIDQHAKEKNWVPVAYNLCDEPGGERIKRAVLTALAHRKIPGLERTLFMGETSMRGANPKEVESHGELVKALQIPTLAFHDEAAIKLIKDAGGRFGYYNDGYRNDEGDRFGNGRYLWMLAHKHGLAIRMNWHFNIVAGDPYYDLDGREGDACWFNTDENQTLVPRIHYLAEMLTGLNDYRYLITLDRLVKEKPAHPAAAAGKKILEGVLKLEAGKDRDQLWSQPGKDHTQVLDEQRNEVIEAIVKLLE